MVTASKSAPGDERIQIFCVYVVSPKTQKSGRLSWMIHSSDRSCSVRHGALLQLPPPPKNKAKKTNKCIIYNQGFVVILLIYTRPLGEYLSSY